MKKIENRKHFFEKRIGNSTLSLDENIEYLRLLLILQHELNTLSSECLRSCKVTITQAWILMIIAKFPGLTLTRISNVLEIPLGTLSSVIKKMIEKKLLERIQDPADLRRTQFFTTDKGRKVVILFNMRKKMQSANSINPSCDEDTKVLSEYLRRITQRLRDCRLD